MTTPAHPAYTLEQVEDDLADLRGQVALLDEYQTVGGLVIDGTGGPLGTGLITGPDPWHSLGSLTGFTVTLGRYKLAAADNMVIVDIEVTNGGTGAASVAFANAMAAAYRPTQIRHFPLGQTSTVTAGNTWPRVLIGTDGTVTVVSQLNSSLTFGATIYCPLD